MIFGNPLERMAQSWSDVYQHYHDYWKFRLINGPDVNYRHYRAAKQRKLRHKRKNHHYAQSRQDGPVPNSDFIDDISSD